ncbi:hypothetical protein DNTS_026124 [Danionella cerebrum]|uniref:Kinase suppressor RAS 1 N-terminal helical hairpin domain-containing protein n=1 Tax=Danionella cerebrum TaxID=2873325 RepID=A0A553QR61_9TELE|nr:hypothetical protein DNTS_026124 [Danionella translucida]
MCNSASLTKRYLARSSLHPRRSRCSGMDGVRGGLMMVEETDEQRDSGGGAGMAALQQCELIQNMIDISISSLQGLRTKCAASNDLTQQEIRTLEVTRPKCSVMKALLRSLARARFSRFFLFLLCSCSLCCMRETRGL